LHILAHCHLVFKAQRELKMRLDVLDRQDKKRQEKRMEENIKKEMNLQKERVKALKNIQRSQVSYVDLFHRCHCVA
jgi:hypothetical protein